MLTNQQIRERFMGTHNQLIYSQEYCTYSMTKNHICQFKIF